MAKKQKPWRSAKVFGRKIPIYRFPEMGNELGFYDTEHLAIAVAEELKGEILEHTVAHEILHATLDRLYLDSGLDEKLVEAIIENSCVAIMENFKIKWRG